MGLNGVCVDGCQWHALQNIAPPSLPVTHCQTVLPESPPLFPWLFPWLSPMTYPQSRPLHRGTRVVGVDICVNSPYLEGHRGVSVQLVQRHANEALNLLEAVPPLMQVLPYRRRSPVQPAAVARLDRGLDVHQDLDARDAGGAVQNDGTSRQYNQDLDARDAAGAVHNDGTSRQYNQDIDAHDAAGR